MVTASALVGAGLIILFSFLLVISLIADMERAAGERQDQLNTQEDQPK